MITICFTTRNRDLQIVDNCLNSIANQSDKDFECFLVDYGSEESYLVELKKRINQYSFIKFIDCPTKGQLWSKCRALNIALKKSTQPYFVVGDIDLIFHSNYIEKIKKLASPSKVFYFQYGYLDRESTIGNLTFENVKVSFKGNEHATGNTMFPKDKLMTVNGFDEFYHGWGAEDTDTHIRMRNYGMEIQFIDNEIIVKHQWHPKAYRSKESKQPFHSLLERINHAYMNFTIDTKRVLANENMDWGKMTIVEEYISLNKPSLKFNINNSVINFDALLFQLKNIDNQIVDVVIVQMNFKDRIKNILKKISGKKYIPTYEMSLINNFLLEEIIKNYRNCPYTYSFDRKLKKINLTINL